MQEQYIFYIYIFAVLYYCKFIFLEKTMKTENEIARKSDLGSTHSSVGRAPDSWSQGRGFDPHSGRGVVSLSKTLPNCLVLVKPWKPSQNDWKIVDWDIKQEQNKTNKNDLVYSNL